MLRGLPVERWSVEDSRLFFWGLGLHLGVPRPQSKASQYMSDVREAGGTYRSVQGRGYNTKSALDFHADGGDLVGLMCLRTGVCGGESLIASSITAHNTMLAERPGLLARLYEPVPFSRQGEPALPESWQPACKDVEARAVRGGFRSLGITPQIESFEARMAAHHAMAFRIYADRAYTQGVRA